MCIIGRCADWGSLTAVARMKNIMRGMQRICTAQAGPQKCDPLDAIKLAETPCNARMTKHEEGLEMISNVILPSGHRRCGSCTHHRMALQAPCPLACGGAAANALLC